MTSILQHPEDKNLINQSYIFVRQQLGLVKKKKKLKFGVRVPSNNSKDWCIGITAGDQGLGQEKTPSAKNKFMSFVTDGNKIFIHSLRRKVGTGSERYDLIGEYLMILSILFSGT